MMFSNLFHRGGKVEATTDVLAELEREEQRKLEAQAEQIARERRSTEEYRAKNAATLAEFLKRSDANRLSINDHVAALLLLLPVTKQLVAEAHSVPWEQGGSIDEKFGFPVDFPDRLLAAIREAAPNTQWNFNASSPLGLKSGPPELKGPQEIRVPRFADDMAAPPGFAGTWDRLRGRPFEEPGPIGPVLPF